MPSIYLSSLSILILNSLITLSYLSQTYTDTINCTSKNSYTYHKYYCQGLKRCKSEMKVVSMREAKSAGRKECG